MQLRTKEENLNSQISEKDLEINNLKQKMFNERKQRESIQTAVSKSNFALLLISKNLLSKQVSLATIAKKKLREQKTIFVLNFDSKRSVSRI